MVRPYAHLHYFSRRSASAMLSYTGWHLSELALRRQFPLRQSIFRFRLKRIAYELIKGTKDQLYVMACSSGGTATNPASV